MRRWQYSEFGTDVDRVMVLESDIPIPVAASGKNILLRMLSTSVNAADWRTMRGDMEQLPFFVPKPPRGQLGTDGCGVVVNAASGEFKEGDIVCFECELPSGACAEYCVVPVSACVRIPAEMHPNDAVACIGVSANTAWTGVDLLFSYVHPKDDEVLTFLVLGGASGVGSCAVQFLKSRGHRVICTASAGKFEYVRSIGADDVIDYKSAQKWWEIVDAGSIDGGIFQACYGAGDYEHAHIVLNKARGAAFVTSDSTDRVSISHILWQTFKRKLFGSCPYSMFVAQASAATTQRCAAEVANGLTHCPKATTVYEFDDAHEAYRIAVSGHSTGKMVLHIADP